LPLLGLSPSEWKNDSRAIAGLAILLAVKLATRFPAQLKMEKLFEMPPELSPVTQLPLSMAEVKAGRSGCCLLMEPIGWPRA
jgi:hypothetical protein